MANLSSFAPNASFGSLITLAWIRHLVVLQACAVALGGTDLSRREEAEIYLFNLFPTYDNVPPSIAARGGHGSAIQRDPGQTLRNAEQLLQHAQTSWAKYFAATVMLSLINSHFGTLDLNVKSEIRK